MSTKPRFDWKLLALIASAPALLAECKRQREQIAELRRDRAELVAALAGLFDHCVMVHRHWGEGSNQKQADAAQTIARALLTKLGG